MKTTNNYSKSFLRPAVCKNSMLGDYWVGLGEGGVPCIAYFYHFSIPTEPDHHNITVKS